MKLTKKKKVLLAGLGIGLLLGLMTLFTNVYLIFLPPLEADDPIDANFGDVILVLGGGLRKGPEIGYSTEERLNLAVKLFHRKKRILIISDGSLYRRSPAIKKMTDFLVSKGVPHEFIRLEGKSQTTYDNVLYSRKIIEELNSGGVIICTSPYHQRRVRAILNHLELENFKIAAMERSEIFQADSLRQRMRNIGLIFHEYMAIMKFKFFTE